MSSRDNKLFKKYYDSRSACQVLGCLMINPNLVKSLDYTLDKEDFVGAVHKSLYVCIHNLSNQGLKTIDLSDIENYMHNVDPVGYIKMFEKYNGEEWILSIIEDANIDNFDYYYRVVRKYALLRSYIKNGVDVSEILELNDMDTDRQQIQLEEFDKLEIYDIIKFFDWKNLEGKQRFTVRDGGKSRKAGDNARELREMLKQTPSYGFSFESEYLTTITQGAIGGRFMVESRDSGCVDCDTEFFDGKEWKRIADYKDGDLVLQYNKDGSSELVKPYRYIKNKKDKLWYFKTNYGVDQCLSENHNVVYFTKKGNIKEIKFEDLMEKHYKNRLGFRGKFATTFRYDGKGIELSEFEIRLMCAVICDGTFKHEYANKRLCRINIKKQRKKERLEWILDNLGIEYKKEQWNPNDLLYNTYIFESPRIEKEFGDYWYNCTNKQLRIICDEILEWDGSQVNNRRSFSTVNKTTADFIQFAFSSCGIRTTITTLDRTGQQYKDKPQYIRKSIEYVLTMSNNKMVGIANYNESKIKFTEYRTKDGYEYCFTVPSHMLVLRRNNRIFITGNCGKTRNAIKRLVNICAPEIWSFEENRYIVNPNGTDNRGLYIGTEMDVFTEIEPMMWAFISGLDETRIKNNELTEDEEARLDKAIEITEQTKIFLEDEEDFDCAFLWQIIEQHKLENDISVVAIDYIELGGALTLEYVTSHRGMTAREDQVLLNLSKNIKSISKNFNVFIYAYTQTNDEGRRQEARDQTAVKGGKSIPNKADFGMTSFEPTKKELELLDSLIHKANKGLGKKILPNICYTTYKNRWFNPKKVKIWGYQDLGTMEYIDLFCTNEYYEPINIVKTKINNT